MSCRRKMGEKNAKSWSKSRQCAASLRQCAPSLWQCATSSRREDTLDHKLAVHLATSSRQCAPSLWQCATSSWQEDTLGHKLAAACGSVPQARGKSVCRELAAVCRKLAARACTASSRQCAASSRPCLPLARGLCHNLEAPLSFSSQAEPKFHSAGATCQYRAPLKITPYKYPATTQ